MLVHIKSGSAIITQLGVDPTTAPKGMNLQVLKGETSDIAVHCDKKYTALGYARFDDGETQDLDAYTEFEIHAKGANPYLGSSSLDIDVKMTQDKSTDRESVNQNMGSVIIYNAGLFSLGPKSKAVLTLINGSTVELTVAYLKDFNIARFDTNKDQGVPLREIKNIHIKQK